ncbi:MAG: HD domain-containing protein [Spirochaetaceae bacterium]|nr:HD domain-containing protein [Spirochaetaceae bacterium]
MEYRAIRDPLWKHIYLPEELAAALTTPDFVRLSRIRQLGPAELVYPGAVHTRAGHSLGVYEIARRILERLEQRGADWITSTGRSSWYAAALFHDIGHFPYTHSLKELPLEEHEVLSGRIVLGDDIARCIAKAGGDPHQVAAIIDTTIPTTDPQTLFYRRLLSGVLDPDKLDYLNRDAYYCGVPYGIQDTEFTLDQLQPHKERGIMLDSAAILSVENLLFSKYLMYRSVYWHRQVRIATAMMKKALYAALSKNLVAPEELYQQDDQGIHHLLQAIPRGGFPEIILAQGVAERQLYKVVTEIKFDSENPFHRQLESLQRRHQAEEELAESLAVPATHVLIDIPERISFESDLWICDEELPFSQSSTVFSSQTVAAFTGSLRKIRVAVREPRSHENIYKIIARFFELNYN